LNNGFPGKGVAGQMDGEVTAVACTCMTSMGRTLILNLQLRRSEGRLQPFADHGNTIIHGRTFLKGLMVTLA